MRFLLGFLPMLACAGAMFVCLRMLAGGHTRSATPEPDSAREIAKLREEVARFRAELARDAEPSPASQE